jgi:hypothetical protein
LAGRRADANHFSKLALEQKGQLQGLKQSLEATSQQLHASEASLSQVCRIKMHVVVLFARV